MDTVINILSYFTFKEFPADLSNLEGNIVILNTCIVARVLIFATLSFFDDRRVSKLELPFRIIQVVVQVFLLLVLSINLIGVTSGGSVAAIVYITYVVILASYTIIEECEKFIFEFNNKISKWFLQKEENIAAYYRNKRNIKLQIITTNRSIYEYLRAAKI